MKYFEMYSYTFIDECETSCLIRIDNPHSLSDDLILHSLQDGYFTFGIKDEHFKLVKVKLYADITEYKLSFEDKQITVTFYKEKKGSWPCLMSLEESNDMDIHSNYLSAIMGFRSGKPFSFDIYKQGVVYGHKGSILVYIKWLLSGQDHLGIRQILEDHIRNCNNPEIIYLYSRILRVEFETEKRLSFLNLIDLNKEKTAYYDIGECYAFLFENTGREKYYSDAEYYYLKYLCECDDPEELVFTGLKKLYKGRDDEKYKNIDKKYRSFKYKCFFKKYLSPSQVIFSSLQIFSIGSAVFHLLKTLSN